MIHRYVLLLFAIFFTSSGINAQITFNSSASFQYLKGIDAATLPANWMTQDFDASGWLQGNMPFRNGTGTGGTVLSDMPNNYSTVYLRSTFNASQISDLEDALLSFKYNDGFVIWINGEELFSMKAPDDRAYNGVATGQHTAGSFETFRIPARDILLKEGENLIAIQGFNMSLTNPNFYFEMLILAELPLPQTSDSLKVIFSQPNGFYDSPFDLSLSVPDDSYNIWYTIDGSNPQISGTKISGGKSTTLTIDPENTSGRAKTPCYIVRASLQKEGLDISFPLTQTYIFLDQVITQTDPGGDWPSTGNVNGQVIDLNMDPTIAFDPQYSGLMRESLTDIPSISVVTDNMNLFNPAIGMYVNAMEHGDDWERMCSVELINPSGEPGFDINAGLRIRGGWSRHDNYPKHAFRLFFREEYGAAKLKYPLFEDEGVDEFDKIDLRCEQNYAWSHPGDNNARNTAVREVFSRDTQREMGHPYTRSRYYHLYLNGMYWGLYQTQERSEARYAADYLGGSKEDYDVVKITTDGYVIEATDGNLDSWNKIYDLSNFGFATNPAYFALEGKDENGIPKKGGEVIVDIDNLIDYMLIIFYTGNFDSPTSAFRNNQEPNNFYAIDRRDDRSSGFMFFAHDAEHTMMIESENVGIGINENRVQIANMNVFNSSKFHPQWLHYKLTFNKEYRQRVADLVYKNFFNNGVFVPQNVQARFQARVDQLKNAMIGESARWGDFRKFPPYNIDDWKYEINDIYTRYIPYRSDIVLDQLRAAGLYFNFDPPVIKKNNITLDQEAYPVSGNYQISLSATTGQIYYTLDGTDPRLIGGQVNPTASEINSGGQLNLEGTNIINARVKNGDEWSALASVKFLMENEDYSSFKVTELHYHPTDSLVGSEIESGKSFEFIEFKNIGEKPINLTGLNFTSSINYQFKENEVIAPNQFYVIASKPKWFFERHFMVPTGNFSSNFANSGEQVTIADASGGSVINFMYSDLNPWATEPDGLGSSLSAGVKYPNGNPSDYSYWKPSTVFDGSPFADDPGVIDSIDDPELAKNEISVYPNPTRGSFRVKVGDSSSEIQIEIHNLLGSKIYSSTIEPNDEMNMNELNVLPGIYLVSIRKDEKVSVHKLIYRP